MQGEATCLLGPCPAHTGAKVYKDDTLSSNNPRKFKTDYNTEMLSLSHRFLTAFQNEFL